MGWRAYFIQPDFLRYLYYMFRYLVKHKTYIIDKTFQVLKLCYMETCLYVCVEYIVLYIIWLLL